MSGIHSYVQPAISSNRLGIETKFQLSQDIPDETAAELVSVVGAVIPDYRFWIPVRPALKTQTGLDLVRSATTCKTHLLCSSGSAVKRLRTLQQFLSLGFVLNAMFIPELHLNAGVIVSVACHLEPFNFHPRLLTEGNQIDGCLVTFTYDEGALDSSVEMMIISVICRICGFSRM